MQKTEAIELVLAKYPDRNVAKVTETDKYFLISLIGKTASANAIILEPCNDGLKAVDKNTKEVFTYNPIKHK